MGWPVQEFSRGAVNRAGDLLRDRDPEVALYPAGWPEALRAINNWRAVHSYPLQAVKMTLRARAIRAVAGSPRGPKPIVAQRLKRLESIVLKLRQNRRMSLTQMQDIGGCRAVMGSVADFNQLVKIYDTPRAGAGPELIERYDYIATPKPSGYRGMHYVFKYQSSAAHKEQYNNLRIEVQVRSALQHAWATAVETASTLTGQALKSNIGEDDWKRFFALMGGVMARRERTAPVPDTPTDRVELVEELREFEARLNVRYTLQGYGMAVQSLTSRPTVDGHEPAVFMMVLDPTKKTVEVRSYRLADLDAADEDYLDAETSLDPSRGMQAVLVSAESIRQLKRAYPNYFLDTRAFVRAVDQAIGEPAT